jgi:hypothetical protein
MWTLLTFFVKVELQLYSIRNFAQFCWLDQLSSLHQFCNLYFHFQLENGFLSQEGSKEKIPDILTTILHGLNAERKCTIPISKYFCAFSNYNTSTVLQYIYVANPLSWSILPF